MAEDPYQKPQVVRSPTPRVEAARQVEERRRVAEIARDFAELERALERRDRLARSSTAARAESSPAQAGPSAGGARERSTPEPKPLPTVAEIFSVPIGVSPQVRKLATIPANPQQRKLVAEGAPTTRRRKWRTSLAVVIIVLFLVSGAALMLIGPPIEIAQDAYRRAVAEMQRLTARENSETEAAPAAEEKALAEEAERKAAEKKLAAAAAAPRHEEEAQQAAEDARFKAEEAARRSTEGKLKSDADVREQAKRAEADMNLSEQDRKKVQVFLTALGFNTNGTDGAFGPRTRAMITAWQKTQGLPETGYMTEAQLATLRQQAAAALAKYDQRPRRVKEDPRGTK